MLKQDEQKQQAPLSAGEAADKIIASRRAMIEAHERLCQNVSQVRS